MIKFGLSNYALLSHKFITMHRLILYCLVLTSLKTVDLLILFSLFSIGDNESNSTKA